MTKIVSLEIGLGRDFNDLQVGTGDALSLGMTVNQALDLAHEAYETGSRDDKLIAMCRLQGMLDMQARSQADVSRCSTMCRLLCEQIHQT